MFFGEISSSSCFVKLCHWGLRGHDYSQINYVLHVTRNWTIVGLFIKLESTLYTLTSVMPPSLMSLFSYPKTYGNACSQFKLPSLLSHFPPIYADFLHQSNPPKHSNHTFAPTTFVITAVLTFCYSIVSHATLFLDYHPALLTLHTSLMSRALWLAWS